MFSLIRKESLLTSDVLLDSVDCHNHILPNIDDGVKHVGDAIDILDYYENIGVRSVIFTPHIKKQFPNNNYDSIRTQYDVFASVYQGNVRVNLAAEYMLDSYFEKHFATGKILTLFEDHILLEFPEADPPFDLLNRIQNIMSAGYFVVLAHPERYLYLNKKRCLYLKEIGVKFQLNVFSLLGMYGQIVKKRAANYLKNGIYDCFGTDLHAKEAMDYFKKNGLTKDMIRFLSTIPNKSEE